MFAIDFLRRAAKATSFRRASNRAFDWLRGFAAGCSTDVARAYGFYVLARAGTVKPSDLRYFADTDASKLPT